jgi:teichuronic acid biosynthesis glycosyltransferase TuaH
MLKNKDIIIVGQQSWDVELGSNCKNIALELSKNNRVLYVNPPLDRYTRLRHSQDCRVKKRIEVIRKRDSGLVQIDVNLWNLYPNKLIESINWVPSSKLFRILNKRNSRQFGSSIKGAIKLLGFHEYLLFNDNDLFRSFYLKEILQPEVSIYYSRDNIVATRYWGRHGKTLEPELIAKSDICFSNSEYLKNYCLKYNDNSYYVGQGCDFEILTGFGVDCPPDLKSISSPIIGYIGALTSQRLDLQLIQHIAKSRHDWSLVLVGPQDECFRSSSLHKLSNVFFLGPKPQTQLAAYINAFDVCINPQQVNELTIGNYPRKIDEYLFLGKPVVATDTQAMGEFDRYVLLAKSENDFVNKIAEALRNKCEEGKRDRKEFALSHSWVNSVNRMAEVIQLFVNSK